MIVNDYVLRVNLINLYATIKYSRTNCIYIFICISLIEIRLIQCTCYLHLLSAINYSVLIINITCIYNCSVIKNY